MAGLNDGLVPGPEQNMYNLIIVYAAEYWDESPVEFDRTRIFEGTSPALRARFVDLDTTLSLPCLFAYEDQQKLPARIGRINKLQKRANEVRIHFEFDEAFPPIDPVAIAKLKWELDVGDFELNRTHWAIKDVDLLEALLEAGIITAAQRQASKLGFVRDPLEEMLQPARTLEDLLMATASGEERDEKMYADLRRQFMRHHTLRPLLPDFVRDSRNLAAFWRWIKDERHDIREDTIYEAFGPMFRLLEDVDYAPSDSIASDVLQTFDADGVYGVWLKALDRRSSDPPGALTLARTLVETVVKRILDDHEIPYSNADDLPKLYKATAKILNLAPEQHSEEAIKRILGGAANLVGGLGRLRNVLSDAHGQSRRRPARPSPRHANLAVNTAGAIATFLVETHNARGIR